MNEKPIAEKPVEEIIKSLEDIQKDIASGNPPQASYKIGILIMSLKRNYENG